jgi:hypothetical protein
VKYRHTEHSKEERENVVMNISNEKEKATSPKKDKIFWKIQTDDGIRQHYSRYAMSPEKGRELTAHTEAHHQCWRLIHGELARFPRMEILVHLWREMSTDDLGRTTT